MSFQAISSINYSFVHQIIPLQCFNNKHALGEGVLLRYSMLQKYC